MGKISYNNFMTEVFNTSNYIGTFAEFKDELRRYFTRLFIEEYDNYKYFECEDYAQYLYEFMYNNELKLHKGINKICKVNFDVDYSNQICTQIENRYRRTLIDRYYLLFEYHF